MIYTIESISLESMKTDGLRWLFRISPAFALGEGLVEICKFYWLTDYQQIYDGPFAIGVSGSAMLSIYGSVVPYFVCLLLVEVYGDYLSIMRAREWLSSPSTAMKHDTLEVKSDTLAMFKSATKVYLPDLTAMFADDLNFLSQVLSGMFRLFRYSLLAKDLPEELQFKRLRKSANVVLHDAKNLSLCKGETIGM